MPSPVDWQDLPYPALANVFSHLSSSGIVQGGDLVSWTSHHHLSSYATICRSWRDVVQVYLYESVAIVGERKAHCFLRTVGECPKVGRMVKRLVVGLEEMEEEDGRRTLEVSREILQVVRSCGAITSLQVNVLHEEVGRHLLDMIRGRQLKELVIAMKGATPGELESWPRLEWRPDEVSHLLPTLTKLELDYCTLPPPSAPISLPLLPLIPLTGLRICYRIPPPILLALLTSAGPTLILCDIYHEDLPDARALAQALLKAKNNLEHLRFISNPPDEEIERGSPEPPPLFDRILSSFRKLESLLITSTDISIDVFRFLPSCLEELEITTLSPLATFGFHQFLLDDLRDEGVAVGLKRFTIVDGCDSWSEDQEREMREACVEREIQFFLVKEE